jgi:hypothetical protein
MVQHLAEGDGVSIIGEFRDVFADIVVERKKSLFGGQHHAGRGELFCD